MQVNHAKQIIVLNPGISRYLRFPTGQQQRYTSLGRQFFITATMLLVINDTTDNLSEVLLSTVESRSAVDLGLRTILIEKTVKLKVSWNSYLLMQLKFY